MEVVASLSQGRTAAAQYGLFTHKSVPVIFEGPCTKEYKMFNTSIHWRTQEFCSGGGCQQIQTRTEDIENVDLGAVAP